MKFSHGILGVSIAAIVAVTSIAHIALAWHPNGSIVKKVEDITAAGPLSDADSAATGISAKPGDTLQYVISISNSGTPDSKGYNDMAKTVMTDTLPDGV